MIRLVVQRQQNRISTFVTVLTSNFCNIFSSFTLASLDDTTAWLQAAASEEVSSLRDGSESASPDSQVPISAMAVLNRAYMRLLRWDPQDQKYPEVSCSQQNYAT